MDVREYILHLQNRPGVRGKTLSHTVSNRVRAIRAFFAWLARSEFSEDHLLKNPKVPKTSQRIVEPLTKEEVEIIFARMTPQTMIGSRNSALLYFYEAKYRYDLMGYEWTATHGSLGALRGRPPDTYPTVLAAHPPVLSEHTKRNHTSGSRLELDK